jgi:quercetin dioxygenase-like cupin family protein
VADSLWFLDTLVTVRVAWAENTDHISVLEHRAPAGDSPPLHVHHTEDEVFCVLEGTLRLRVAGQDRTIAPGRQYLRLHLEERRPAAPFPGAGGHSS